MSIQNSADTTTNKYVFVENIKITLQCKDILNVGCKIHHNLIMIRFINSFLQGSFLLILFSHHFLLSKFEILMLFSFFITEQLLSQPQIFLLYKMSIMELSWRFFLFLFTSESIFKLSGTRGKVQIIFTFLQNTLLNIFLYP